MRGASNNTHEIEWLKFIIAFLLVVLLIIAYTFIGEPKYDSFWSRVLASLNNTIPSLIAVLMAFMTVYYFLRRKGLVSVQSTQSINKDELAKSIISGIIEDMSSRKANQKVQFFEQFYTLQWDTLLHSCSRLDLCVHYFDNWVSINRRPLRDFIDKGGIIRIILPNYQNEELVRQIKSRFPEHAENQLAEKINSTQIRLETLQRESNRTNALKIYFTDNMIWYCGIRLDNRTLILSPFEHKRTMRVEAPAIVIPLDDFKEVQDWFDKEFSGLLEQSKRKSE